MKLMKFFGLISLAILLLGLPLAEAISEDTDLPLRYQFLYLDVDPATGTVSINSADANLLIGKEKLNYIWVPAMASVGGSLSGGISIAIPAGVVILSNPKAAEKSGAIRQIKIN